MCLRSVLSRVLNRPEVGAAAEIPSRFTVAGLWLFLLPVVHVCSL